MGKRPGSFCESTGLTGRGRRRLLCRQRQDEAGVSNPRPALGSSCVGYGPRVHAAPRGKGAGGSAVGDRGPGR